MTEEEAAKIRRRIERHVKRSRNGCWLWIGATSHQKEMPEKKYGQLMGSDGRKVSARRASYEAFGCKPDLGDKVLGSTCGNCLCVSPEHLILGTRGKSTGRKRKE